MHAAFLSVRHTAVEREKKKMILQHTPTGSGALERVHVRFRMDVNELTHSLPIAPCLSTTIP